MSTAAVDLFPRSDHTTYDTRRKRSPLAGGMGTRRYHGTRRLVTTPIDPGRRIDAPFALVRARQRRGSVRRTRCFTLGDVTGADGYEQWSRTLLGELIGRVSEGRVISDLLASEADAALVTEKLRPLVADRTVIDTLVGSCERVDAVVTAGDKQARVVFAYDDAGLLIWLDVYLRPNRFDGVSGGRIIVVNGPSGVGKSVLMQALQAIAAFPLVVLDEPEQIGTVQRGYLIWRDCAPSLHRGYLAAIAALARSGNHVVLPAAGHPQHEIAGAFDGIRVVTVGLTCEFEVLQERERRTGRWAGIAAESLDAHAGWTYDLEFDTTNGPDPLGLARLVLGQVES